MIYIISYDPILPVPAHIVIHFAKFAIYTVYRRIVNTPATEKLAVADKNEPAHLFRFFSGSQKTLKINLIR